MSILSTIETLNDLLYDHDEFKDWVYGNPLEVADFLAVLLLNPEETAVRILVAQGFLPK